MRTNRRFASVIAACLAPALLAGCGAHKGGAAAGPPGVVKAGTTIRITLTASADCNNCGTGPGAALKYRVLQVADEGAMRTALNKGLPWSKQVEAAGANVVARVAEDFVNPGKSVEVPTTRDPKAAAIVIEGNFCKKVGASWYVVYPLTKKGPIVVNVGATGMTLAPSGK